MIEVMHKSILPMFILAAAVVLLEFSLLPGLAAGAAHGSRPSAYQWRHNPFIPLLKPKAPDLRERKGGQAAPYENFSLPPDLKLKAVIKSNGQYKAIVGSQLVVPDDLVMGFIVAEIHPDRVVLLKNGRVVELSLRSKVDRKENFSISRVEDDTRSREPSVEQRTAGGKDGKSFIRLTTAAREPGAFIAEHKQKTANRIKP
jgi:hypothetical protein